MDWNLELERKTLAEACRDNFELFARLALGFTHPKNKKGRWWSDPVHKPLCAWFQQQALDWLATRGTANRRKYLAILIPRACAKSLLITRAGMLWLHLQDPNLSTYIGNEKLELAEDFLRTIKRWLEGSTDEYSLFNWLYGTWKGDNNRWRSDTITHAARTQERSEASFGIWSPNAALTGRHPDIVCMDDLVSYDALKKDVNWYEYAYSHMTDLIPVVEGNGLVILVGTRYSDADPFGRSFKSDGIRTLAGHTDFKEYQTSTNGRWDVYFLSGRDKTGDKPAIPTVWPEDEMRLYEMRDPIKFASQVLNRPRAHKLRPLVEEQFDAMVVDTTIEQLPKMTVSFHGDTAFKSQKRVAGGSESALVVVGHHDNEPGVCTVLDAISGINFRAETYADMVIERFKYWSARFPIMAYTDEAEMAGKAGLWQQYLSDRFTDIGLELPTFYAFQRQVGEKKEIRIADAIHFIVNGQVKFHKAATNLDALRYQLCNHPNAYPNDLADCFADTFNPEFFSGLLPKLRANKEEYPFGAWEQHLKPRMMAYDDTMDNDELDRQPIRRAEHSTDASSVRIPFAEQGVSQPALRI